MNVFRSAQKISRLFSRQPKVADLPAAAPSAQSGEVSCFVPHVGWLTYETGDAVLAGLREGDFEYLEQAFFQQVLRPGDVFVDCGAHCGLYTRLAAPLVAPMGGALIAIEPAPAAHALLRRNTADLPGAVSLHQVALGDSTCEVKFITGGSSPYNHMATATEDAAGVIVGQLTLPRLLQGLNRKHVDFLKIDSEGRELAILTAASSLLEQGAIRALMIEFNEENLQRYGGSCTQLAALLKKFGYHLFAIDRAEFRLVPARPADREAYANYFATKDEAWLQRRFAEASGPARQIAADILQRGEHVHLGKTRRAAESQTHIDSLLQQINQLAQTIREQDSYIAALQRELVHLRNERLHWEPLPGLMRQLDIQPHLKREAGAR